VIASYELGSLPAPPREGSVVSIGVFDGVHLGHLAILEANRERARALGAQPTVVTFRRHPKRVLLGREPRTLTSLEHRLELFRRAGIEHTLVLAFDERLREVSAEEFVRRLIEALGARAFVLGFDSKFGRDRRGTPALLQELGLDVQVVDQVVLDGRPVSSTAIREAVELGDLPAAERMLGRPVSVLGSVVRGDELGRRLGFPTANLDLHHELHPPPGVYAGRARILDSDSRSMEPSRPPLHPAVINIGVRPTVAGRGPQPVRVEAHLLGFCADLYGRSVELSFLERLRDERRFASLEELSAQIARDVERAREVLARGEARPAARSEGGAGSDSRGGAGAARLG
jgi:riboflavin kinase/FMN adenylyltransferase